ncbi:MAG: T9SS type A sorting domain-containing protein [Bacteroidota bacterium]
MKKLFYALILFCFTLSLNSAFSQNILINPVISNVSCNGNNNGDIHISPSGGVTPYIYNWAGPSGFSSSLQNIASLAPGSYNLTVTDFASSTVTATYTVTEPQILNVTGNITNVSCFGFSSGSVDISVNGGTAPFNYYWSSGETTQNLTGKPAGTYSLIVIDFKGCMKVTSYIITEPQLLTVSGVIDSVNCYGGNDGSINLSVNGGTAPFNFGWSNLSITQNINGLSSGIYSVTVTDAHLCSLIKSYHVYQPDSLWISGQLTNISCHGFANGSVDITVHGGTSPDYYSWSNATITQDLFNVVPNTYTVTVSDYHNCTKIKSFIITEPALLAIGGTASDNTCYAAHNGSITTNVSGGTLAYQYLWSNAATTPSLSGLIADSYNLTVTDAHGCIATHGFVINEPAELIAISGSISNVTCPSGSNGQINLSLSGGSNPYSIAWSNLTTLNPLTAITAGNYEVTVTDAGLACSVKNFLVSQPAPFTLNPVAINVSCFGGNNGSVITNITGATPAYTYNWSGPLGFSSTVDDISNLISGNYLLTITDLNSCTKTTNFNITQPNLLTVTGIVTDVACHAATTGSIDITVLGGNPAYNINWSNGAHTEDLIGIGIGTFNVSVTDQLGCTVSSAWTLTQPSGIVVTLDSLKNAICPGGNSGKIYVSVNGGVTPYTYLWSDGSALEDRPTLIAGTYHLTVTDHNFCTLVSTYTITAPADFVITPTLTNIDCHGNANGAINLVITGGTPAYSYLWNNNATSMDITNLTAGTYTITVTDSKACSYTHSYEITQPDVLNIMGNTTNPSCYQFTNGSILTLTSGGTSPFTYHWNDNVTSPNRTGISSGTYHVTVTDYNGCTDIEAFTLINPQIISGNINTPTQNLTCSGNSIIPISFTADYYTALQTSTSWTRDQSMLGGSIQMQGSGVISGSLMNWTPNDITVTFTIIPSANGCEGPSLTASVLVPHGLRDSIVIDSAIKCNGGLAKVSIYPYNGTPPYIGGGTYYLTAGSHVVSISDNAGCMVNEVIQIIEPTALMLTHDAINSNCSYSQEGSILLSTSGGTPPYNWLWNDGSTSESRNNLSPGIYTVTATDANSCSITQAITVNYNYSSPNAELSASTYVCTGNAHTFTLTLTGTPPFAVTYTDGAQFYTINDIQTNVYTFDRNIYGNSIYFLISVQDAHCNAEILNSQAVLVLVYPLPTAEIVSPDPICSGDSAHIKILLTGTAPWTITYSDGSDHTISNILTSPYFLNVTATTTKSYQLSVLADANCYGNNLGNAVTLVVHSRPSASMEGITFTRCYGTSAAIPIHFTGTPPWSFSFTDGVNIYSQGAVMTSPYYFDISPEASATYTLVSVQDAHCPGTVSGQTIVNINPRPVANWNGSLDTVCESNGGTFSINLSGTPPWHISWYDVSQHSANNIMSSPFTFNANPLFSTNFVITALNDVNCPASAVGQTLPVFVDETPTAVLVSHSAMCSSTGGDLKVNLTGVAPWELSWSDGSGSHVETNILATPYYIHVSPLDTTTYFLLTVTDKYCTGTVENNSITVIVHPSPVATVSGLSPEMKACQGTAIQITPNFAVGTPAYSMLFLDANMNDLVYNNLHQGDVVTFNPPVIPNDYSYKLVSITDSNGCFINFNMPFNLKVNATPIVDAGPDVSLNLGDSIALQGSYISSTVPTSILWSPASYLSNANNLHPYAKPIATTLYSLFVTDSNGCQGVDQVEVTMIIEQAVFGYVKYDNAVKTPLSGINVILLNSLGVHLDSTMTNSTGYYELTGITNGNYSLLLKTDRPWMLQNATDALLILKHFVQIAPLTGVRLKAANVDGQGPANSTDALLVAKRFTGQVTSFNIGNWVFETVNFSIPSTVYQHNIKGLCSGDVNGSSIPSAKIASQLNLEQSNELAIEPGKLFTIPVRINKTISLGAASLILYFPAEKLDISEVTMPSSGESPVYNITNNELRLAWFSLSPANLIENDILFNISARLKHNCTAESVHFDVAEESQIVDGNGQSEAYLSLIMPKLVSTGNATSLITLPNPASTHAVCVYSINADAFVRISLFDPLGKEIKVLQESNQLEGNYNIDLNLADYASGLYFLKMEVHNGNGTATKIEKLSILK